MDAWIDGRECSVLHSGGVGVNCGFSSGTDAIASNGDSRIGNLRWTGAWRVGRIHRGYEFVAKCVLLVWRCGSLLRDFFARGAQREREQIKWERVGYRKV